MPETKKKKKRHQTAKRTKRQRLPDIKTASTARITAQGMTRAVPTTQDITPTMPKTKKKRQQTTKRMAGPLGV
jgi:hypothetical protein